MKENKVLKVHIEHDAKRNLNVWVLSDSQELFDEFGSPLMEAYFAAEDWMPKSGAKLALITDIVAPNLFRNVSLINPLELSKSDIKTIPPILCLNDQVFEICDVEPKLSNVRILKSLSDISFFKQAAKLSNFHLVGLCNAI